LHEGDTSGIILEKKLPYVHLMLPMRFESERRCITSIGFRDPRIKDGELLFPARFSEKKVQELELTLGTYAVAGQLQQRPAPRGGGLFKTDFINLWPAGRDLPDMEFVLQSYDTAFTDKTANDPTACTVWGIFTHSGSKKKCAFLLDAWDLNLNYPELRKKAIADFKALYGGRRTERGSTDPLHPPRRADLILMEDKGSGISLLQDLRAARLPVHAYNPGRADKWSRAQQTLPLYELDLVYIPESAKRPGEVISWAQGFLRQLTAFGPKVSAHDDYVDTFTQALIYLRDRNLLLLPQLQEDEQEESESKTKKGNPYAV
jgi:predicted phage terminase large subunit-like protein